MKCTACDSPIRYKGGENKKDHGCNSMTCPARVEAVYFGNVSVREGWWFAESYHLPFKCGAQWFAVVGPNSFYIPSNTTTLQKINTLYRYGILDWNRGNPIYGDRLECSQEAVWSIPYMALPVNEDFNREFTKLVNKFDRYLNKLILLD